MNHDQRGWWDPHSDARGDVCSLVQHLDHSLHSGHVRQVLRRFAGVAPRFPEALRLSKAAAGVAPAVRWAARPRLRQGSAGWHYLTTVRRVPALVLTEAARLDTVRATGGGMGPGTVAAIAQILAGLDRFAAPELASAADADDAGERYAVRHAELARSAGIPFVRLTPTVGADWNDVLKERGA